MPAASDPRVLATFDRRFNSATWAANVPVPPHTTNGDEALYADKCGTYSKVVRQESPGKVDPAAFALFRKALGSGQFSDFEKVPIGGTRTFNGPMGGYAYAFVGIDGSQLGDAPSPAAQETAIVVPPAPALASDAYAAELIELYWASLLRDVAFIDYATDPTVAAAAAELSNLPAYAGPRAHGVVTPDLLFRGNFDGETVGPYISQLLLLDASLGALSITQKYQTYAPGLNYMGDLTRWFNVQNGRPSGDTQALGTAPLYFHDGRGLGAYTDIDENSQEYLTAYFVLRAMGAPMNPGNPYVHSKTQNGFGTFGYPDVIAVVAEVAKLALNSVWYQKWPIHLRHRPEAGGGMVQLIHGGVAFDGSPAPSVFSSQALQRCYSTFGTYLLTQGFTEGSPAHPAYPTGHGAVGGACITVLKFFFDGKKTKFTAPVEANSAGTALQPWNGHAMLDLNGELNKLARNITFGHGIHPGIHWRSDSDASLLFGEAVALAFLADLACSYAEPFTVSLTKLDGSKATISNE